MNEDQLDRFIGRVDGFHDSCLKELKYVSGAYVDENLSMYPLNDRRILRVVFQQQRRDSVMIELAFGRLRKLKLFPLSEKYTCEMLDVTLIMDHGLFYWADTGGLSVEEMKQYDGTVICAEKLCWRIVDNCMGNAEFYLAPDDTVRSI